MSSHSTNFDYCADFLIFLSCNSLFSPYFDTIHVCTVVCYFMSCLDKISMCVHIALLPFWEMEVCQVNTKCNHRICINVYICELWSNARCTWFWPCSGAKHLFLDYSAFILRPFDEKASALRPRSCCPFVLTCIKMSLVSFQV